MKERFSLISEKEIFIGNLEKILEILDKEDVDYRLVGGFAIDAYLGEEFNIRRKSGIVRDVDIIVLSTEKSALEAARREIKIAEASSGHKELFPKVGLNQAYERETPFKRFGVVVPAVLSGFMVESGRYYLVFNDLREEIPPKVTEKAVLNIEGLQIPSFYPETILHLYLVRGGSLKVKDLPKLSQLARRISLCPTPGLTHDDFLVFHTFAQEMRIRYPLLTSMFRSLFVLDQLVGNRISSADRLVYGIWRPIQHSGGNK